jgi:hydroxymethylglutaryl-CoA reductase
MLVQSCCVYPNCTLSGFWFPANLSRKNAREKKMTDSGVSSSRLVGFRDKSPLERRDYLQRSTGQDSRVFHNLAGENILPVETANGMIENAIGKFELPLGLAANLMVNGRDYLVPMAVEEPSVIAAVSFMAKIARENGGFHATSTAPIMRAQIQVLNVPDPQGARHRLLSARKQIIGQANECDRVLADLGGGCKDLEVHIFEKSAIGPMVVLHLLVDVRDAMGANAVNTMAEAVAPTVAQLAGGDVRMRILSNLADLRLASARVEISPETLQTKAYDGDTVARGIVEACALAEVDPYRAATHNKGIMNGIDPVVIATGNDWRAIEAGAHAFAARSGRYTTMSRWEQKGDGTLVGTLELPLALGLVGGATKTHPAAQAALKLLNVASANELAEVIASVGLAQNMAALRALSTEGIQRGHMALHARNLAIAAGASGADIDRVAKAMVADNEVTADKARTLLSKS